MAEEEPEVKSKKAKAGTDEPDAVIEAAPGAVADATEKLGKAVAASQQNEQGTADAEGQHSASIQAMENIIDQTELSTGELVFDIRDFLLNTIKARPKPWSATSQGEQRDVAAACEHAAKELVRKVVETIASQGDAKAIRVLLTKVNAGGDDIVITGKVKFLDAEPTERDHAILALHHGIGKHVMLNRASADDYMGGGREAETDSDEPEMQFEAGHEDDEG